MNSRSKGKRLEREAAHAVRAHWEHACRRTAQVDGGLSADLIGPPGLHLEVKGRKRLSVMEFMRQADSDRKPDAIPVVLLRENRGEFMVMLKMKDTKRFLEALRDTLDR